MKSSTRIVAIAMLVLGAVIGGSLSFVSLTGSASADETITIPVLVEQEELWPEDAQPPSSAVGTPCTTTLSRQSSTGAVSAIVVRDAENRAISVTHLEGIQLEGVWLEKEDYYSPFSTCSARLQIEVPANAIASIYFDDTYWATMDTSKLGDTSAWHLRIPDVEASIDG